MNLSKNKRWKALLHRMIVKQQAKREQTYYMCLQAVEKYKKVESINKQTDYKTMSKKWTVEKKTGLIFP